MVNDITSKRLEQLVSYLKSLDNFKVEKYISDIVMIISVTLERDYKEEIKKINGIITTEKATYRKIVDNEIEEEFEYGLNQGDKNQFSFGKEWTAEKIKTAIERTKELEKKIEQLNTYHIDYNRSIKLEQISALFELIKERKELYKYEILNLLEPIVYHRAIRELSNEIQHCKINNDFQATRVAELKEIINCFKESLFNSQFICSIIFKEQPKDERLF